jgi:hypothetical protein
MYLERFNRNEVVRDIYDDDDMFRMSIGVLIRDFEYPDWAHKTVGMVLAHTELPEPNRPTQ